MHRFRDILKFFLIIIVSVSEQVQGSKECRDLLQNQTTFDVHYWEYYPYTSSNSTTPKRETQGLFNVLVQSLSMHTTLNLQWGKKENYGDILAMSQKQKGSPNKIALPIMIEADDADPCHVKLYESKRLAYVVRRNFKKPLKQLGNSFINGGQVIGLTLILTGIAGICMWLLDRRRNPKDFPAPFITGSWQGFWWAFVTMTTVGYGDLAPKSVPARMFSILWMLLGLVAFSVLTANFTSSLAREIETDLNLFNKKIAVFNGSIARKATIDVGGKYSEYNNLSKDMLKALKNEKVEGLLVDQHAVVCNKEIVEDDTLEIGKMIDFKHYVGLKLIMPQTEMCIDVKRCMEKVVKLPLFQEDILKTLTMSTISKSKAEHSGSLFEDYEFFIILIALFSVMTGIGILWEYFWYNPRMLDKVNKIKTEENELEDRNSLKYIMTDTEVKNLCEGCCERVEAIYSKDGQERKERLKAENEPHSPKIKVNNLLPSFKLRNKEKEEKDHV